MRRLILKEQLNGTTVSGTFSKNTMVTNQGILMQILVEPTSSDTQYNISITDDRGMTIYERESEEGRLAEEMLIPIYGLNIVKIWNATKDEAFKVQLVSEE